MRLGVDTGGTFTDVVSDDGRTVKVLSDRVHPERAVARGLAGSGRPDVLAHGTTVATNALLERRGGRIGLVTNRGFADVLEIARQVRPSLYDPFADRPEPLVPRELRFEVAARLDQHGAEVAPLDPADAGLASVPDDLDGVVVCLLHSDLAPAHERRAAAVLRARGLDVTCSHEVSPEHREYERLSTAVVNAYLRPVCGRYLRGIEALGREVLVMTSAGGLASLERAARVPAALLLSGPAAGVGAAAAFAGAAGFPDAVSFDMGGTSTDVCLVLGGAPAPAPELRVGGLPVRLPSLEVHTIGAGGGSIAAVDPGGALVVGPRSAGADPGPACYGRGGVEPCVTDADLLLGRIDPAASLGDLGALVPAAAGRACARAGVEAEGVCRVVDAMMERAVRTVTVARGVDPRRLALVAFGGAGPLHACAVAEALDMPAVVVPPRAGVLSAVGLLAAPRRAELVRTWPRPRDHHGLAGAREALAAEAARPVPGARVTTALDCRYAGQGHELTVPSVGAFGREHLRRNGYERPGTPVEVVALRARADAAVAFHPEDLPVPERPPARGPVVVSEADCTVFVADGWRAEPGPAGTWLLTRAR